MKKYLSLWALIFILPASSIFAEAESQTTAANTEADSSASLQSSESQSSAVAVPAEVLPSYTFGPEDIIEINVLRPETILMPATVSADGMISFPYIGSVMAKGKTSAKLQEEITEKLADGYMKYPVVTVALKESHSRKFFIYGEVVKPGSYPMEENMTVFRALALAGGFTKFGNSSKVKILRPRENAPGYETIGVDIKAIMNGSGSADVVLKTGDVVAVSEGIF